MTEKPTTSPFIDEHVKSAAEYAYVTIQEEIPGYRDRDVHRQTVCHRAAELMLKYLVEAGVQDAERETRDLIPCWTDHSYVTLPDGRIADPTWQQFVDSDRLTEDTPRVLIGSRDEVIATLIEYGVSEEEVLEAYMPNEVEDRSLVLQ